MMAWFVIPFDLIAGAFITVQAGSNAELKKNFGEPTAALLVNYVLGFGAVLIYGLATRLDWPGAGQDRRRTLVGLDRRACRCRLWHCSNPAGQRPRRGNPDGCGRIGAGD